ncbi:MAG: shikimate dehydrogenase [Candidatus Gorgyraea atricola]|nr:shikimate dehydrogenase [Candidatus Gorgyraea atricola]
MDTYGIIGYPVKHSLSPAMHNAAFKKLGIDAEYRKFEVKPTELEGFLLGNISVKDTDGNPIHAGQVKGFNITIPHKVKAKEILEKKFPNASSDSDIALSGAVNTVKRVGDKLEYRNTDVSGFGESLDKDLKFGASERKGSSVFILGCGGVARAIIADLENSHVRKIYVYDIDKNAVDSAENHFSGLSGKLEFVRQQKEINNKIKDCKLLVNATPIGMEQDDESPIDKKLLHKDLYVYDVVYNRQTQLVKDAFASGAKAVTGEGMLAWQGVLAFFCWIDRCKPVDDVIGVMRQALDNALER